MKKNLNQKAVIVNLYREGVLSIFAKPDGPNTQGLGSVEIVVERLF